MSASAFGAPERHADPRPSTSFRKLIESVRAPQVERVLDVGAGGFVGATTTIHLLDVFPDAELIALEPDVNRASALGERYGKRVRVVVDYLENFQDETGFDLVVVDLDTPRIPHFFTSMIPHTCSLTRGGGLIVAGIITDLYAAYHGDDPLHPGNEAEMLAFMLSTFGHLVLTERVVERGLQAVGLEALSVVEKWPLERSNYLGWVLARHLDRSVTAPDVRSAAG